MDPLYLDPSSSMLTSGISSDTSALESDCSVTSVRKAGKRKEAVSMVFTPRTALLSKFSGGGQVERGAPWMANTPRSSASNSVEDFGSAFTPSLVEKR